jgi:hypothetical protein
MMETVRTITYDDKTYGRQVITFPPELPFAEHVSELLDHLPNGESKDALLKVAVVENVFKQANLLAEHLGTSSAPHEEILSIAALAAAGEPAGLKLMYASLLAIPPAETLVSQLDEFRNVRRVMAHITRKEKTGKPLKESEEWFKKKIVLLSTSHPLPGPARAPENEAWLGWSDGVKRALADPDRRWEQGIIERAKAEIEALDLRINVAVASLDFERKPRSMIYLLTTGEENRWRRQALQGAFQRFGEANLVIRQKLAERWEPTVSELRTSKAGAAIAGLIEKQMSRVHPYPYLKTGTAVIRGLLTHPLLVRTQKRIDYLSCLAVYVVHAAGNGTLEILFQKLAGTNILKALIEIPGFHLDQRILTVDLKMVPPAPFVGPDDMPRDVNWTNIQREEVISYRTLVMTYMDNDNFIAEILSNPRIASRPGVVPAIAQNSRSMRILSIVANRRDLHTGILNKEVPINLLQNPARVPVSALRKFIHVRYVDKATLARLAGKGSQARDEIRREVQRYLSSLK